MIIRILGLRSMSGASDQRWQVPIYFKGCELAALRPTGQLIVLRVPKFVADKSSNGILASVDFGA
jgi:hypothetical protein